MPTLINLDNCRIEKIIHQIVIGDKYIYKILTNHNKKYAIHHNFKYRLWKKDDITLENFPYTYKWIIKAQNLNLFSTAVDFMKYEIMFHHGGCYFDAGFELNMKKSINDILENLSRNGKKIAVCHEFQYTPQFIRNTGMLSCGWFISTKNHPAFLELIKNDNLQKRSWYEPPNKNFGPHYFGKIILNYFDDLLFEKTLYFYPYWFWDKPSRNVHKGIIHNISDKKRDIRYVGPLETNYQLKNSYVYLELPTNSYIDCFSVHHGIFNHSWHKWSIKHMKALLHQKYETGPYYITGDKHNNQRSIKDL